MDRKTLFSLIFWLATSASADTTLRCEAHRLCDAYAKNCVTDPYTIAVNVDPKAKIVAIGKPIKADFSNPAEVTFEYLQHKITINKFDYSIIAYNQNEVRMGLCSKIEPAW
jgi:hypothetical protein